MGRGDKGQGIALKEFIRDALVEIVDGVAEARETVAAKGASIGSDPVYGRMKEYITDANGRAVSKVEFDIALTKTDASDAKGGIGVFLGSVGIGSQGGTRDEATAHSRIRFSVPLVFPGEKRQRRST